MKYNHFTLIKHIDAWLHDGELDYFANELGWMLVNITLISDTRLMYTFRAQRTEE